MVLPTNKVTHAIGKGTPPWAVGGVSVALPVVSAGASVETLTPANVPTPDFEEDFGDYTSISNFLTHPNGYYASGEFDNTGQMSLTAGVHGGQALRYTFADLTGDTNGRCSGQQIISVIDLRNAQVLGATQREVWAEIIYRPSSNFKTQAPAGWSCGSAADYKFILGNVLAAFGYSGSLGRFEAKMGKGGGATQWAFGPPGEEDQSVTGPDTWDNDWHTLRMQMRCSSAGSTSDGLMRTWVDGSLIGEDTNVLVERVLWGLSLGRNMNQGPDEETTLDFDRVRLYTTDPGW